MVKKTRRMSEMTFTGGEVDRIVNLLSEFAPPHGWSTELRRLLGNKLEVELYLPEPIAREVASIAREIASIAGEAACIAREVASILSLPKEERSLFPRRQKAKLEPKQIDGGQTGRPADES